jgi:hypothetical protein
LHLHAVNRTGDHPDPGQSFTHLDVCRFWSTPVSVVSRKAQFTKRMRSLEAVHHA